MWGLDTAEPEGGCYNSDARHECIGSQDCLRTSIFYDIRTIDSDYFTILQDRIQECGNRICMC